MNSSPRVDVAIVLLPRVPGDAIAALGQPGEAREQASPIAKVEQALDALDRAFHPEQPIARA